MRRRGTFFPSFARKKKRAGGGGGGPPGSAPALIIVIRWKTVASIITIIGQSNFNSVIYPLYKYIYFSSLAATSHS